MKDLISSVWQGMAYIDSEACLVTILIISILILFIEHSTFEIKSTIKHKVKEKVRVKIRLKDKIKDK